MLRLYQTASCPFCQLVLAELQRLQLKINIDYELIEAPYGSPERVELETRGGKSQVPFLVDGNVQMYESMDIVRYIYKKFSRNQRIK